MNKEINKQYVMRVMSEMLSRNGYVVRKKVIRADKTEQNVVVSNSAFAGEVAACLSRTRVNDLIKPTEKSVGGGRPIHKHSV